MEQQQEFVALGHAGSGAYAGLETFPKHPSFVRENFERGWSEIIGSSLKSFLEKQQAK